MVAVGRIGRPHGLGGEVRLEVGEGLPRGLRGYTRFYLGPAARGGNTSTDPLPVVLEGCRPGGRFLLLKFAGVSTPEAAATLVHSTLYVERSEMPALAPGEYYHADLLGCRVVDGESADLGVVDDVYSNGAHDVMVVRAGGREWMVPVVERYVEEMDLEAGVVRVRLPEGGL